MAPDIFPADAGSFNLPPAEKSDEFWSYLTRQGAAIAPDAIRKGEVYPQAAGAELIALWLKPRRELPPQAIPLDIDFGDKLQLVGWEPVKADEPLPAGAARSNWQIALYWQALGSLVDDYTVSVRPLVEGQLITIDGEPIIQDHQPVWGVYPTNHWTNQELVRDVYALAVPDPAAPDAVQIVVYKTSDTSFENLDEITIQIEN